MFPTTDYFNEIIHHCQNSSIGKQLPNALYVHRSAINYLELILQEYEQKARITDDIEQATIVKFNTDKPKISYLFYPNFDLDPHPELTLSIVVNLETQQASYWDYTETNNPPILHRKETFVTADYPHHEIFEHLTYIEEKLGLLKLTRSIGTKLEWEQRLNRYRLIFEGHYLACLRPLNSSEILPVEIERHKAAIVRKSLSRPVRLALESSLFVPETSFFDYGCGHGGDIERIAAAGYESAGWDPYYRPDVPKNPANIVNLGYIINVIEDLKERREALIKAWELTRRILIVSAQVLIDDRDRGVVAYGDGIITSRNTFQKYYEQEELKAYIDQVLNVDAIPAGLGIYFVFKDEAEAQTFRVSRFHSRAATPRIIVETKRFEDYELILQPLMDFHTERGRLPINGELELENEVQLKEHFRTFKQAFKVILQVTNEEDWDMITQKRRQDLLLYLALSTFSHRPKMRELSPKVKQDIKSLFGSYNSACLLADAMLYQVGNLEIIAGLCQNSSVGRKLKNSLLIHISALESLETLLRLYEGCASRTVGRLEEANVIQFSWRIPKITYLFYPDFDTNPHPTLHTKMQIELGNLRVNYSDYSQDENPPILHYKDSLVTSDYPLYETFAKLTQQEQDLGLLEDYHKINRLQGWLQCLAANRIIINQYDLQQQKDDLID
ncbi:DNA phosphorothioation-associated putative methyltransferase [Crocosphaera sp. UHCC 0190]|uniref:DNA phosphorothioation-associated putative methyltransferase n=1 Tax=Crocosphaera sp. UHCC 0190 TaxID=3110246 RepID=UPI002B215600|nr:DNA phosphorothioation-associated putative methyltransferase [Crocosphaera sp. UHCC 0190]MEA5511496.1 DNA phosphorothioation-associated putative methyltransferase [Crocosphaera sp. UHCC 0190]